MDSGKIKAGDLFWSRNANVWMLISRENIGRLIDDFMLVARKIEETELNACYYSFLVHANGDHEPVKDYTERPADFEMQALADESNYPVRLMEGRIIGEYHPKLNAA